ncbi:MAG: response regulator transcription factor [Oscillospiraceae bacterium]
MGSWILAVGYDKDKFASTQAEWLKYHILIRMVTELPEAVRELSNKHNTYLLVAIFSFEKEYLAQLPIIRHMTNAPILIMKHRYDGEEKIVALESGADEYIEWPNTISESVASGRALIRRYTELNKRDESMSLLAHDDIVMCIEYRKVFICTKEVTFTRQEFDFLQLLLKNIGQVFSYEQISNHIWGEEHETQRGYEALWCLVSKVRNKVSGAGADAYLIQTKREVGYCIGKKQEQ